MWGGWGFVMFLQRGGVIASVITKDIAAGGQPFRACVADQHVPVVMPDFMAEMTEQGAVIFPHLQAHLLALGVIGLVQRDGDDPVHMPGHGRRAIGVAVQKIEGQPFVRVLPPVA